MIVDLVFAILVLVVFLLYFGLGKKKDKGED